MIFLLFLAASAVTVVVAEEGMAGAACGPTLQKGVYGMLQAAQLQGSYNKIHQAACQDYDEYSYEQYTLDTEEIPAIGRASSFNIAAGVFAWGAPPRRRRSSSYFDSEQAYDAARAKGAAYRACACDGSEIASSADSRVRLLTRFIEPSAAAAYTTCLQLFASGVRVQLTSDLADSRSFAATVQFVPVQYGSSANLTGIRISGPSGAACCEVVSRSEPARCGGGGALASARGSAAQGRSSDAAVVLGAADGGSNAAAITFEGGVYGTFPLVLQPNVPYSLFCQLDPDNPPADGQYTTVYVYATAAQVFSSRLYHRAPLSQLEQLQAQLATLRNQVAARAAHVQSGTDNVRFYGNYVNGQHQGKPQPCRQGRTITRSVRFADSFAVVPSVVVAPRDIDGFAGPYGLWYTLAVLDITTTGFTYTLSSRYAGCVGATAVTWIAHAAGVAV